MMKYGKVFLFLLLLASTLLFLGGCAWLDHLFGIEEPELPQFVETLRGSTDQYGVVLFHSDSLKRDIRIQCIDAATGAPVEGLEVSFAHDGVITIAVVTDPQARYLPNLFAGTVDDVVTPAESPSAQLIHPQNLVITPIVVTAGTLIVKGAKYAVIGYGLYSTGEAVYGIITDPPTLKNLDLHLDRRGAGMSVTFKATPDRVWDAVKTGLGIVSLGKGKILIEAGRTKEAATWATEHGFNAVGSDLGKWLTGRLGFEWDREYAFTVDFFRPWIGKLALRRFEWVNRTGHGILG